MNQHTCFLLARHCTREFRRKGLPLDHSPPQRIELNLILFLGLKKIAHVGSPRWRMPHGKILVAPHFPPFGVQVLRHQARPHQKQLLSTTKTDYKYIGALTK